MKPPYVYDVNTYSGKITLVFGPISDFVSKAAANATVWLIK